MAAYTPNTPVSAQKDGTFQSRPASPALTNLLAALAHQIALKLNVDDTTPEFRSSRTIDGPSAPETEVAQQRGTLHRTDRSCSSCNAGSAAAQSYVYLMKKRSPNGDYAVELGFDQNPLAHVRPRSQGNSGTTRQIVTALPVSSDKSASQIIARMNAKLKQHDPNAQILKKGHHGAALASAETYHVRLEALVVKMLDAIDRSALRL